MRPDRWFFNLLKSGSRRRTPVLRSATSEDHVTIHRLRVRSFSTLCGDFYTPEEVYDLSRGTSAIEFIEALSRGRVEILEAGGHMAGYLWIEGCTGRELAIDPEFAGKGFGRLLVARFCELMSEQGVRTPEILATLNSVGFYERLGFITLEERTFSSRSSGRPLTFMKMRLDAGLGEGNIIVSERNMEGSPTSASVRPRYI